MKNGLLGSSPEENHFPFISVLYFFFTFFDTFSNATVGTLNLSKKIFFPRPWEPIFNGRFRQILLTAHSTAYQWHSKNSFPAIFDAINSKTALKIIFKKIAQSYITSYDSICILFCFLSYKNNFFAIETKNFLLNSVKFFLCVFWAMWVACKAVKFMITEGFFRWYSKPLSRWKTGWVCFKINGKFNIFGVSWKFLIE